MAPQSQFRLAGPAVVVAVLLGGFGLVADEVLEGDTVTFDRTVTMFFRDNGDITNPWGPVWLEEAGRDLTSLGSFSLLGLIVIATVIYLLLRRQLGTACFVALAEVSGTVLSNVLKSIFDRPRPDVEAATRVFTSSFPSGHATLSAVVYLTLGAMLAQAAEERRLKLFFVSLGIFLTLLVGVSRVYLGVHYPTDVIAGWSLGASWAILCWTAAEWVKSRRRVAAL